MSGLEIERKYLLYTLPDDIAQHQHTIISQGYITTSSDNEVRIRAKGNNYFMTIKQGTGLKRTEVEIAISEDQFNALWELTIHKRVEKTRYDYKAFTSLIEIDVYVDTLAPLMVAEVEFPNIAESQHFEAPSFFGLEVTEDKAYKNASLAVHGVPDSYLEQLT